MISKPVLYVARHFPCSPVGGARSRSFTRQHRGLANALAQPLLFWVLLDRGMQASFRPAAAPTGPGYMEYFYPGVLTLVMLFTAIFATIAIVEDRREGFLQ